MTLAQMLLACAIWGLMIVWWFWEYVQAITHRQEGETFIQTIERGGKERALNKAAKARMFGGPIITSVASIVSMVVSLLVLLVLLWVLQGKTLEALLASYVVAGVVANRNMALAKHKSWERLNVVDRLRFGLTHAWLWPLH